VEEVSPDNAIDTEKYAVVIAIMPSSLTQPQMANFVDYVKKGKPTLIFDDPMPIFNMEVAPRSPKPRQGGGMFGGGGPPPEQKADDGKATSLVNALNIQWFNDQIVFDSETPEPKFRDVAPPELIFIHNKKPDNDFFNPNSEITKGLQLMLAYFPGTLTARKNTPYEFTPLLYSGVEASGLISWDKLISNSFMGMALNPNPVRKIDEYRHVIAAQIRTKGDSPKRDVIYVADADIMNDNLATIAEQEMYGLKIDNIVFVLNCVDYLTGNKEFIELRKKRLADRKLDTIAKVTAGFIKEREVAVDIARAEGEKELEEAKKRFQEKLKKVEEDQSLDERAKARVLRNIQETEQRTLDVRTKELDQKRDQKVDEIKAVSERKITNIKDQTRLMANIISSIPAILLGLFMLFSRVMKEQANIQQERLVE
jgi:ABC-2 type transport system permease protein